MFWGPIVMLAGTWESEGGLAVHRHGNGCVCALFEVIQALDLTGEQSTTEWAVLGSEGDDGRKGSAHE